METYATIHAIARNTKGEYLILQRAEHRTSPGKWNFITGYIQERESAESAALRELKEETNLEGKVIKTAEPWWRDHTDGRRYIIVSSLIEVEDISHLKIDEKESQAHKWIVSDDGLVKDPSIMKENFIRLGILDK